MRALKVSVALLIMEGCFGVVTSRAQTTTQATANVTRVGTVRMCHQFGGGNAGEKLAACIADIPSTGGTADARGFEGKQVIARDICSRVTKPVTILFGAATFTVSAAVTCGSNVNIEISQGGVLDPSDGFAISLRGGFKAPLTKVLDAGPGDGDVNFNDRTTIDVFYPQWWGVTAAVNGGTATTSVVTENTALLNYLFAYTNRKWKFPCGTYWVNARVAIKSDISIEGEGYCSEFKAKDSTTFSSGLLSLIGVTNVSIRNIQIDGNRIDNPDGRINGIHMEGGNDHVIDTVWCEDIPANDPFGTSMSYGDCFTIGQSTSTTTTNVTVSNVVGNNISRNGFSVLKANRVSISNITFRNILSRNPGACFEFEPDGSSVQLQEVTFSNGNCAGAETLLNIVGDGDTEKRTRGLTINNIAGQNIKGLAIYINGSGVALNGCSLYDVNTNSTGVNYGAIHISGSTAVKTSNVAVSGCSIIKSGGYGVSVTGAQGVTVTAMAISAATAGGIWVNSTGLSGNGAVNGLTISANAVMNTTAGPGLLIDDAAATPITALTVSGNTFADSKPVATQTYGIRNNATQSQSTWFIGNNTLQPNLTGATLGTFSMGQRGSLLTNYVSLDYSAWAGNDCQTRTITVTGAFTDETVQLGGANGLLNLDSNLMWFAWVSAANTVSVKGCKLTAGATADPPPAAVRVTVTKP